MIVNQVQQLAAALVPGSKYTFRRIDPDLLGLQEIQLSVLEVELCQYAQYENAVQVKFIRPRCRKPESMFFYADEKRSNLPVVWAGFQEKAKIAMESLSATVSRYKYRMSSPQYVVDAIQSQPDGIVFCPAKYSVEVQS